MTPMRWSSRGSGVAPALVIATLLSPARADVAGRCADAAERGSDLRTQGRLLAAAKLFEECSVDACPRIVREDCRVALHAVREATPRVTVRVRDAAGLDAAHARVTVDGAEASPDACAQGIPVDPGAHVVRASLPDLPPLDREVIVAATDRLRAVELAPAARPDAQASPAPGPRRTLIPPPEIRVNRTPAIATGAFGLASLGVFGVLGIASLVDYQHLKDTCHGACSPDQVAPARTRAAVGDVFLGAGVVTLAVATALWFAAPKRRPATSITMGGDAPYPLPRAIAAAPLR
jgi:hypothetical protein